MLIPVSSFGDSFTFPWTLAAVYVPFCVRGQRKLVGWEIDQNQLNSKQFDVHPVRFGLNSQFGSERRPQTQWNTSPDCTAEWFIVVECSIINAFPNHQ